MTVQTAYTKTMRRGLNGQVAWDFADADIVSGNAEAVVNFGAAVIKGVAGRSVIQGSVKVLGFAVRSILNQHAINNSFPGPAVEAYGTTETVGYLRQGYVWITNKGAAAILEGENVRISAAGLLVEAAAVGAVELATCRVEKGGAVGEVCLIRVNL